MQADEHHQQPHGKRWHVAQTPGRELPDPCHPHCNLRTVPMTTQARFTEAILRQMAGIHFPMDRIFSQTVSGQPKSEVRGGWRRQRAASPGPAALLT